MPGCFLPMCVFMPARLTYTRRAPQPQTGMREGRTGVCSFRPLGRFHGLHKLGIHHLGRILDRLDLGL